MKHSLSTADADAVNAATGFGRDPQDNPEDNPGAAEGDSYDALELPNGNRLIFLGVREGVVVGVEVEPEDNDDVDVREDDPATRRSDTNPTGDDYPSYASKPRPDGWENYSGDEKRAYVYGDSNTQASANRSQEPVSPQNPPASA